MSSTMPSWSTARHSQCFLPAILMATSSRCHLSPAQGRRRRIRLAKSWPNFRAHCRTVSWLTMMPRAASISSTMRRLSGKWKYWTSPLRLEGLLTNPGTPGGKDGGEENPTELHEGVQGTGGEAAAERRQGAVGGGDGAWHWHRAAQPVAHRAPGGRLGRGTGRPQGGAGGNAATEARGEAPRRGGGDPPQGGGFFARGIA